MMRRLLPLLLLLAALASPGPASAMPCEVNDAWAHEPGVRLAPDANETFVGTPQVLRVTGDDYAMFYASGATVGGVSEWSTIRIARSVDGVTWAPGPVILEARDFGVHNLLDPHVILGFDGKLSLYVEGWDAPSLPPGPRAIYLARALTLNSWTPIGVTLPAGAVDDWPRSPEVMRLPPGDANGSYRMYYTGYNLTARARQLFTAVSADGLQWTKQGMVLGPGPQSPLGPSRFTMHPERSGLRLYYTEDVRYDRVLTALSTDGVNWTHEGPVLALGPQGDRDRYLNSPTIVDFSGGARLYYMGAGSVQQTLQVFSAWVTFRNSPPMAVVLAPATVPVLSPVEADASASQDGDGDRLTYSWSLEARPNGSVAALPQTPKRSFFFADKPGAYVVRLQVADVCGGSAIAFAAVTAINGPPTISISIRPSAAVPVGGNLTLDASGSVDPEGFPLVYRWSLLSSPNGSSAQFNATGPLAVLGLSRQGVYLVELNATDSFGEAVRSLVAVVGMEAPPVAAAGPDRSVPVGTAVRLDGSGSLDPGGDALSLSWTVLVRPPGSTALAVTDGENVTITAEVPGLYLVELTATDPAGLSDTDVILIEAWNAPPAVTGCCDGMWEVGSTLPLTAAATDADPSLVPGYHWAVVASPVGSRSAFADPDSNATSFLLDVPGTFLFRVTATDALGAASEDLVTATAHLPPHALVSVLPSGRISAGNPVTLDARESYDPEGGSLSYAWSVDLWPGRDSGTSPPEFTVTGGLALLQADTVGRYIAHLTVDDPWGVVALEEIVFDVVNAPPEVSLDCPPTGTLASAPVCHFTVGDIDPGPPPVCLWEATSVPPGATVGFNDTRGRTEILLDRTGAYDLLLDCADAYGGEDSAAATIFVLSRPPVAVAGPDRSTRPSHPVDLDEGGSVDPDGEPLSFLWTVVSAPQGADAQLTGTGSSVRFTATVPGLYQIVLHVEDPDGNNAEDRITILVEPEPAIPWELPVIALLGAAVAVLAYRRKRPAAVRQVILLGPGSRLVGSFGIRGGGASARVAAVRRFLESHDVGKEGGRFSDSGGTVLVARGDHLLLVAWVRGHDEGRLRAKLARTLHEIEEANAEILPGWNGDASELSGVDRYVARLLGR